MTQEQIFQLGIIILSFILATVIAPLVKLLIAKLPASKQQAATQYVQQGVQAVEQIAATSTANLSSTDKKKLAIELVDDLLKNAGLSVDENIVSTLIESAVYVINQSKPLAPLQTFEAANTVLQSAGSPVNSTPSSTSPAVLPDSKQVL